MTIDSKHQTYEPSIVVDPKLIAPQWSSEETVVFSREMLEVSQPPKKTPLKLVLALAAAALVLVIAAARFFLSR